MSTSHMHTCKSCGHSGAGKFCADCGQSYALKRITTGTVLHDVFHFFTHLEKGFGFTLKQLVTAPGTMQREYMEGTRVRYQKPFSMFIVCASVNAVVRYWIDETLLKYFNAGDSGEAKFRHEYQVLFFPLLVPVIALFTWLLFRKSKYNYAETAVMQLYTVSFAFIASMLISFFRFIWHDMDTAYVELPVLVIYGAITFLNFYTNSNRWVVIAKSLLLSFAMMAMFQLLENWVIKIIG